MKSLVFAYLVFFVITASPVSADFRVATVDINRILNEMPEAKKEQQALDQATSAAKVKIESERKRLQTLEASLLEKKVKSDSPEVKNFQTQAQNYQKMLAGSQEDLRGRFLSVNEKLAGKVVAAIERYAKKKNIQLVLEKGSQGRSAVLFGDEDADITDDIIDLVR